MPQLPKDTLQTALTAPTSRRTALRRLAWTVPTVTALQLLPNQVLAAASTEPPSTTLPPVTTQPSTTSAPTTTAAPPTTPLPTTTRSGGGRGPIIFR